MFTHTWLPYCLFILSHLSCLMFTHTWSPNCLFILCTMPPIKRTNRAACKILFDILNEKQIQIENAVKYCMEHNCKGKKALSTGNLPLIIS